MADASTARDMYDVTVPVDDSGDVDVDNNLEHWPFADILTPYATSWWESTYITGIPAEALGWHVANGWQVQQVILDPTTSPPTPYYTMHKNVFSQLRVLQDILNRYTVAYNDARWANTGRYADVIDNWTALISSTEDYHDDQVADQNAHNDEFLGNLAMYMSEVDQNINDNLEDVEDGTTDLLDGLGTTEVARITEQFAASLSDQLQGLIDRGLYSSAVAADITERNTRDRDEQLQRHYDALAREKAENLHKIAAHKHQGIGEKMSEYTLQLETQRSVHESNIKLMSYFLGERNQLLIGLYGFVERREDTGPSFNDLTSVLVGLGDNGGWITP